MASKKYTILATYSQIWLWLILMSFTLAMALLVPLNTDEREHAYATLLVSEGEIPYLDFFEHHHPLLWYITTPILWTMKENANAWYALRILQVIILFITSIYIYKIAFLTGVKKIAAYTTILTYFCFDIIRITGVEFRPDGLMICLFMIGLYYFFLYQQQNKQRNLCLSFAFFFLSFLSLQKASLLFAVPCLYLLIQGIKNKTIRTDIIHALIFPIMTTVLLIAFLLLKNGIKDYFELNWMLNFFINSSQTYIYTPLTDAQKYTLYAAFFLSICCLIRTKSTIIKIISATYIVYACFVYSWNIRHFQYMLPFYPLAAILIGYTISTICNNKKYLLTIITFLLFSLWINHSYNEIQYLHHFQKNLSTYVMWDKKMLADTTPEDKIIYTISGEHYFGGLKRQALDYYWFNIGGTSLLDYNTYHRHPYPNLRQIISQQRPKIVINGYWDNCQTIDGLCIIGQTVDPNYMQTHYINKGIYYLRID